MEEIKTEGNDFVTIEPKTVMESIDMLEDSLIFDIKVEDFSKEYIKNRMDIVRDQMKNILGEDSKQLQSEYNKIFI